MHFLKQNWFGIFIGLIIFWFLVFFALVAFAPHQDNQERGFVKCTNAIAEGLQDCRDNRFSCTLGQVLKGAQCDVEVIADGLVFWLKGEQPAPWSNYYFTPDLTPQPQEEYFDDMEATYNQEEAPELSMESADELSGIEKDSE